MYRPNKIMKAGSWADPDFSGAGAYDATGGTAVIDMNAPTPAWRSTAPMNIGRSYQNMTLLPDGTVFASGGTSKSDGVDLNNVGAAGRDLEPRHRDVDDGRLTAERPRAITPRRCCFGTGGSSWPAAERSGRRVDQKNAEIYSPPYLFKGSRPTITSLPAARVRDRASTSRLRTPLRSRRSR